MAAFLKQLWSRTSQITELERKFVISKGGVSVTYFIKCVVPENIHTPTMEGIGNSGGVGGAKSPGKSRGEGGGG